MLAKFAPVVDDVGADQTQNDMDAHKVTENEGKRALTLVKWLSDHAIDGVRPLTHEHYAKSPAAIN